MRPSLEAEDDPLERLIAIVDDEDVPGDLAENHDHCLYGAPRQSE